MTSNNNLHESCETTIETPECSGSKCNSEAEGCNCAAEEPKINTKPDKKNKHRHKEHELEEKLKTAFAKANENYDLYLRNMAEFDNFRKRSTREKENVYCDSIIEMVSVFLPIVDNFERALSVEVCSEDGVGLKAGVEMIFKQMLDTFQKLGVKVIETDGMEFDPNQHEAVMHIEDEDFGPQTIVEVFQKGYSLKDKVIRHSMVKVAN